MTAMVEADGMSYTLETFMACYAYTAFDAGHEYPAGWGFSVVTEDGRVLSPVYGYEVYGLRPAGVLHIRGGENDEGATWGACSGCASVGRLRDGRCCECRTAWDESDDYCPHCGRGG